MIKVFYSPQRNDEKMTYEITGEVVTATYKGLTDVFDFTAMPDGIADGIESDLEINPVLQAEKINGVLHLTLLNFIGIDATELEKFPEWIEV